MRRPTRNFARCLLCLAFAVPACLILSQNVPSAGAEADAPVTPPSFQITPEQRTHWSFQPLKSVTPPTVEHSTWPRTDIDRFILAALRDKGVEPVAVADKRTLIRRVTFDLTGLPPTPDEVNAFLADDAPDAFANVVDRLLASPRYGERWGRHWLDVVRYADTAGETADYPVHLAYKYRDYVIDSFNQDKPYDQFLREQIAGDLIAAALPADAAPEKYAEMVTATGYIAVSRRFGFDSENYHHLTIADTIEVLGQSVLGLTVGCARCHDHKYDPVSMADYYALYGIFDSTRYPFAGSEQKQRTRTMAALLPPDKVAPLTAAFHAQTARLEAELRAMGQNPPAVQIRTLHEMDGDFETQAVANGGSLGVLVPPWHSTPGPSIANSAQSPYTNAHPRGGAVGVSFPNEDAQHAIAQAIHPARAAATHDRVYVNFDFRNTDLSKGGAGSWRFFLGSGPAPGTAGPPAVELYVTGDTLYLRNGDTPEPVRPLQPGAWYNVQLALDLDARTFAGTAGTPGDLTAFAGKAFAPASDGSVDHVSVDYVSVDSAGHLPGPRPGHDVDNLLVSDTPIPPLPPPAPPGTSPPATDPARAPEAVAGELYALFAHGLSTLTYGVAEGTPHDARLQKRGDPLTPGETVPRRFLEILGGDALPPVIARRGSGRLQLADWLTRPTNPLTARVFVNRVWQHHFGTGLVPTENDFGLRGKPPTHPQLLDWLAARFIADGWSVKKLHRLILLSGVYQLSSNYNEPAAAADPANELLWRFNRRRLDAESIRDSMLLLGGNLDLTATGAGPHPFPSVEASGFTQHDPFAAVYDSNRRSVYLMTQRIKRHPYLALFDGPDPNASTARRPATTVPTQALFVMNSPFVHDQSAGFARRLIEAQGDPRQRIELAFEMALSRKPTVEESQKATAFLDRYRQQLAASGVPADQVEPAAWAAYLRTLLAGNEFMFVD